MIPLKRESNMITYSLYVNSPSLTVTLGINFGSVITALHFYLPQPLKFESNWITGICLQLSSCKKWHKIVYHSQNEKFNNSSELFFHRENMHNSLWNKPLYFQIFGPWPSSGILQFIKTTKWHPFWVADRKKVAFIKKSIAMQKKITLQEINQCLYLSILS